MKIHVLDMGTTMYGDCILVTHARRAILIDGGHPGDAARILAQLKTFLSRDPPFTVDLLVVTHCHSDHIGCLPKLVEQGNLKAKNALVADENFGWGIVAGTADAAGPAGLTDAQQVVLAGLREENHAALPDDALRDFLSDAAALRSRYLVMLARLAADKTAIVRYGRDSDTAVRKLETKFRSFGMKVLGPTRQQVAACARALAGRASDAVGAVTAGGADPVSTYRRLVGTRSGADPVGAGADAPGLGAALNNQSIVIKVGTPRWAALLPGDMQFARAEIPGLDDMMAALRKKVKANGPYQFIKLPHHTSYNGLDATVLTEWSDTSVFIHSGGSNDPRHPEKGALALLKAREKEIVFLRTDRSGPVTVSPAGVDVPEAEANDFSVNRPPDSSTAPPAGVLVPVAPLPPPPVWTTPQTSSPHEGADQQVEVITRVPHTATEVTVTIRVEPGVKKKFTAGDLPGGGPSPPALPPPAPGEREIRLGGGRPLPKLLFVTCRPQLELNLGQREADAVVRAIGDARPVVLFDLPRQGLTAAEAAAAVRQVLHGAVREGAPFAGVVLVGGYDVVPAHRLDVLDAATRRRLKATQTVYNDDDDFVVWSDDPYADLDEDLLPDLPVSRLADGRRADVLLGALQARTFTPGRRFGVRNLKRDFAAQVFPGLPGDGGRLEVSEAFGPDRFPPGEGVGAVYYMLHGRHDDTSRFWGEEQSDEPIGEQYEAVAVRNVPAAAPGTVVFTGCCWGGLTVTPPAGRAAPDSPFQLLGPEVSIALAYLRAGAVAFIGCTGSHYSPTTPDPDYEFYGKPLHDAFWAALRAGKPPAEALFLAKQAFGQKMPHGRRDVYQLAVELKTFRQFTCLGLGW